MPCSDGYTMFRQLLPPPTTSTLPPPPSSCTSPPPPPITSTQPPPPPQPELPFYEPTNLNSKQFTKYEPQLVAVSALITGCILGYQFSMKCMKKHKEYAPMPMPMMGLLVVK
ncbi:hypothetical protein ACFE04_013367 [Oxalis oulophora]